MYVYDDVVQRADHGRDDGTRRRCDMYNTYAALNDREFCRTRLQRVRMYNCLPRRINMAVTPSALAFRAEKRRKYEIVVRV